MINNKLFQIIFFISLVFSCSLIFLAFNNKNFFKTIETEKLIIKNSSGKEYIVIEATENGSTIDIYSKDDKKKLSLKGNDNPTISLYDEKGNEKTYLSKDGMFVNNEKGNVIGSFTILKNGGTGIGLGDKNGMAAAIITGGIDPALSFYGNSNEPIASLAISNNIPHLVISGKLGSEGILMHGGEKSGMMVLDEIGQLKIFICKDGIFQGQSEIEQKDSRNLKKDLFTQNEDKIILLPNSSNEKVR